jgi:hypothetical protein
MPLNFAPACLPIARGPLPHTSAAQALAVLLRTTPLLLAWPQLPQRSFREQSYAQAAAGFPGLVYDGVEERVYVERALLDREVDWLSLAYLKGDASYGALAADDASGLHELLRVPQQSLKARAIRSHVVGPMSLGVQLTDEQQRPLAYDAMLLEALAQHIHLRAVWQEQQFADRAPQSLLCLDEPFLDVVDSPFFPVQWDDAQALIERVFEGVQGCRAIASGGAVAWDRVLETSVELIVVDAYDHGASLLAAERLPAFLERGGSVAWGIVPATEGALAAESVASLAARLEQIFDALSKRGIDRSGLPGASLVTTSDGLAQLSIPAAERALTLLAEVSADLRQRYKLA